MSEANPIPVIAGSGRSGTTWILDALAQPNKLRTIFEPLHPACIKSAAAIQSFYADPDRDYPELSKFFDALFSGEIGGVWVDYRVRPDRLRPRVKMLVSPRLCYEWYLRFTKMMRNKEIYRETLAWPPIIKMIRSNLLLPWLERRYAIKVAYIVRHPAAVVESKLRLRGEDWDADRVLEPFLGQFALMNLVPEEAKEYLHKGGNAAVAHVAVWCIENQLVLKGCKMTNVKTFHYEDLANQTSGIWEDLGAHLGLECLPDKGLLNKASQQAAPGKFNADYRQGKPVAWKSRFSDAEKLRMQGVLDAFGVDCYAMSSDGPIS